MGDEASKLWKRWNREGITERYLCGAVLDIGCGGDKITPEAKGWDKKDGDGQYLATLEDATFDTVFSSHFLEHLADPLVGLLNQWRVLKPGGYLICIVPDEDLYEQGVFPSKFNEDHKYTWTIHKDETWSPASKNIVDLVRYLPKHKIVSVRIVDTGYDYTKREERSDQTAGGAEAAVECIVQKEPPMWDRLTKLQCIFKCPKCQSQASVIRGKTPEGFFDAWCTVCGDMTEYHAG